MNRIGPWIFAAGLAVLGAGIASTRSASWKAIGRDDQTIAVDMQGVDTLDVGNRENQVVTITSQPPAIRIQWYGPAAGRSSEPVNAIRDGRAMRFEWHSPGQFPGRVVLELPPTLRALSGRHLDITVRSQVGALRIEAVDVSWTGDAQSLDIHARTEPAQSNDCTPGSTVVVDGGQVERLRISIERGEVYFRDLSRVGQIEVHAGPAVGLRVSRIDDLPRIKLLPFDGEPTPEPSTSGHCPKRIPALL